MSPRSVILNIIKCKCFLILYVHNIQAVICSPKYQLNSADSAVFLSVSTYLSLLCPALIIPGKERGHILGPR